jgi:hypothetical protein
MLSYKLMSTAAEFVLYMMQRKSPMAARHARTLCRTLWYGEKPNAHAGQLENVTYVEDRI